MILRTIIVFFFHVIITSFAFISKNYFKSTLHSIPFELKDSSQQLKFSKIIKIDTSLRPPLDSIKLSSKTLEVLKSKGYTSFTPVQYQTFETIYGGADLVVRSRTGTGKTYAFGLPIIERMITSGKSKNSKFPSVLILEPTRELTIQVGKEISDVCNAHGYSVLTLYGGTSIGPQKDMLKKGVNVIVATPGRALDHIQQGFLELDHIESVILDEGDTMLEMGFQASVEAILQNVKSPGDSSRKLASTILLSEGRNNPRGSSGSRGAGTDRYGDATPWDEGDHDQDGKAKRDVQMVLCSATMPPWVCGIANKLMSHPIFMDAVQAGESKLSSSIDQIAFNLGQAPDRMKAVETVLEDIILMYSKKKSTIVFTKTRVEADRLSVSSCFKNVKCGLLHGGVSQSSRQRVIESFRDGKLKVLIATDVAARGLDISSVDLVIQTELPIDADSFVHRAGRTGRGTESGTCITLVTDLEKGRLRYFEDAYNFKFTKKKLPSQKDIISNRSGISLTNILNVDQFAVDILKSTSTEFLKSEEMTTLKDNIQSNLDSNENKYSDCFVEELFARCLAVMGGASASVAVRCVIVVFFLLILCLVIHMSLYYRYRSSLTGENDYITFESRPESNPGKTIDKDIVR